jgi:hypothetical protein
MDSVFAMACLTLVPEELPTAMTEFTLFPTLPKELQVKIWKLEMLPRVIEVHWSIRQQAYFTDATIPVTLHTCHES